MARPTRSSSITEWNNPYPELSKQLSKYNHSTWFCLQLRCMRTTKSQNAWAVSVRRHDDFKALVHKKADFGFVQGFFWAYPRTFGSPLSHKQHNHRDQNEWPTYDVFVRVFHQRPGWSGTRMTMTRRNLFKAGALFSGKLTLWKQLKTFKIIDSEWQKLICRESVMPKDPNTVLISLKINPNSGLYILK